MSRLTALEFFSGIGAFTSVAKEFDLEVLAAYDQSQDANSVYSSNFKVKPISRNLDTISGAELPDADLWWLSPPCTPFTRRGKRADLQDSRSKALVNLLKLLPAKKPAYFLFENVTGFGASKAAELLERTLIELQYNWEEQILCPTQFGIPMQRPRLFYLASRKKRGVVLKAPETKPEYKWQSIRSFIDERFDKAEELFLDAELQKRYQESLNIADLEKSDARLICFSSSYARSMKASGSFISLATGRLRRFAPEEIQLLLGYSQDFLFPENISLKTKYRLLGNSVDLRAIRHLLSRLAVPLQACL